MPGVAQCGFRRKRCGGGAAFPSRMEEIVAARKDFSI